MIKSIPQNIPHNFAVSQTQCILNSYKRWLGKDLVAEKNLEIAAKQIFWAPFAVLSSNNASDPILTYGNQKVLELWEMPWEVLTQTPGRQTAEAMHRDERQNFLDTVKKNGFIDNYSGVRISSTGKRFKIENATVWNLVDEKNSFVGQAATFRSWKYL